MSPEMNPNDSLSEFDKKLPTSLNVLTILTIIGCVIGLIGSIYGFTSSKKTYETMKENYESGKFENVPAFMKGMMNAETVGMYKKMHENRLPILILTLASVGLCFYGALEMRKLRKQGYTFYLIGEVLPIIATAIFIGFTAYKGFGIIGIVIPIIFIILYTVNRKNLVN